MSVSQDFICNFLRNLSVDVSTLDSDLFEKGYEYFLGAQKIMSDAAFELRKWETNLVGLKEKIYDGIEETVSVAFVEKSCRAGISGFEFSLGHFERHN